MNGHFTSEISRMRSDEMMARSARNESIALMKRAEHLDRPVVRSRKVAHLRLALAAAFSAVFVALMSSAAMAYPLNEGHGTASRAISGAGRTLQQTATTAPAPTVSYVWVLLIAAACAVVLGVVAAGQMGRTAQAS